MIGRRDREGNSRRHLRWTVPVTAAAAVGEALPLWRRRQRPGRVVVRCRRGHLFTTIWIPGASIKSVRLGPWRLQRCPVGRHWSLVTPVQRDALSEEQLREAQAHRDLQIP